MRTVSELYLLTRIQMPMMYILMTITNKGKNMEAIRPSTHPGIILKEEFAIPLNLTQAKLSTDLNVGIKTLSELYNKKRGITSLMALKLSEYFGTTTSVLDELAKCL
ncbi:MAG: HigA family addiction module antitoxin [Sulfurimonas sp.]|nr:HigA family addiction module antitoxin [Sulfurimonas sp.]